MLLPFLITTSEDPNFDVRVVTLSSNAHYYAVPAANDPKLTFGTIEDFRKRYDDSLAPSMSRYSVSKLASASSPRNCKKTSHLLRSYVRHCIQEWSKPSQIAFHSHELPELYFQLLQKESMKEHITLALQLHHLWWENIPRSTDVNTLSLWGNL
ncbi:hypothetical protein BDQ12DRAFT_735696 [Crucibulum laeve]|uniref:Uncharacterized protein n=1 Tax=Crucibulum laeve TaxID=68775 RepID=A0A5C3LZ05_9AGAR|nr:hypothetical protein BDQ12DRAFT_735696 [Crucibulum laeve]